jgi:hypothetical protein
MDKGEIDLVLAYTQKFWDAGNSVVTVILGLEFAVYIALYQSEYVRYLVAKYFYALVLLAILGKCGILFVIYRLFYHETSLAQSLTHSTVIIDAISAGYKIRAGLLLFNTFMYVSIITLVWSQIDTTKRPT